MSLDSVTVDSLLYLVVLPWMVEELKAEIMATVDSIKHVLQLWNISLSILSSEKCC